MFSGSLCDVFGLFRPLVTDKDASTGCPHYDDDKDNKKRNAFYKKQAEEEELMWQIEERTNGQVTFDNRGNATIHIPISFDLKRRP